MPSQDFGYQPAPLPSSMETGYTADTPEPVAGLLDPATSQIDEHYLRVMNEDPDAIDRAAAGWTKLGQALDQLATSLRRKGGDLQSAWTSEAGTTFLLKIGSTTYSLAEWQQVAAGNASALSVLAGTLRPLLVHMEALYQEYTREAAELQAQDDDNGSLSELWRDVTDTVGYHRSGNLKVQYNERSRAEVMEPLADAYSTAFSALGSGSRFAGPKDAVVTDPGRLQQLAREAMGGAPSGPGGAPGGGSAPAPPGSAPAPPGAPGSTGQAQLQQPPPTPVGDPPAAPGDLPAGGDAPAPVGQLGPVPVIAPALP